MKNFYLFDRRSAMVQAGGCAGIKGKAMRPTHGKEIGVNPTKTPTFSRLASVLCLIFAMLMTLGVGEMWADTWTVAGDNTSVLGTSWAPSNTANDMIQSGSNWFLIKHVTFASNGTINFKACKDHAWGTSYGAGGSDASIEYTAGTKDVIFVTNATNWAWGMETNYWEVAGDNATLFTNTWNLGQDANKMTYSASSYTKTYSNVPLNCGTTIEWKVAAGKNWDYSFPNANQTLKIHADGTYDITFSFNISTFEATATATPTSDKYFVKGESPLSWNNCEGTEMTAGSDYTSTTYYYLQVNGSREFKIMEQYDDWDNTAEYEMNYTKVDNHVMRTDIDLTLKAGSDNNIVMPSAGYIIYYPGTQKICAATSLTNLGKPYTITYKDQGGGAFSGTQTSAPTTHTYGTATTLKIPTKENYDFGGWFTASDCASGAVGNTSSASLAADGYEDDIILYAKWIPKTYTITYKDQGNVAYSGSNEASLPSSYTYGTGASLTEGVKSGYAFDGWFDNSSCTGSAITSISSSATGAKTFYAKWTENPGGTVTLVAGTGGQVSKDNSSWGANAAITGIKSATPLTIYARPTTGYTFNTWTKTSGLGTVTAATATGTFTPVADADATVTASFTERMSSLTTSNHYDAGNPSYSAPSKSVSSIGITTTADLTAAAPGTGYTFAGWTLSSNLVVTSGNSASDRSITVRTDGNGADATAQANYEEDLDQSTWVIKGGTAISGSNWGTEVTMRKASGASTDDVVYATINISSTNTGNSNGDYKFKVVKKGNSDTYFGLSATGQYYLERKENGTEKTLATDNQDIELRADAVGEYVFKVDYSDADHPELTITFPPSIAISATDESVLYNGSTSLTVNTNYLPSGSKTIEYEFFEGDNTLPANKIGSTQTFNNVSATTHSSTAQAVTPGFSSSDYAASQIYTAKITINGNVYVRKITIYRKWDIYVHDVLGWDGLRLYMWGGTTGDNGGWPGTACDVLSGNWYTVTLSSKYYSGFLINNSSDADVKTNDHHTSAASEGDKNDHDELCSYFEEGSYYYIHEYEWESATHYELNPVDMSVPEVEMQDGASQSKAINTTELFLTGLVTDYGGDGLSARDMAECGFIINGTEYPVSSSCTAEDSGFFWGYVGGLTPGTTYTVSAYAKNIIGRGVSENTASVATRAAGTTTIQVRTRISDPVPYVYAWTWDEVCDHVTLENDDWPGESMGDPSITGTVYNWYTYELSNEYNQFKISENGSNETNNFDNPFEATCYRYHPSEAAQGDRMRSMTCPYTTPQLMINTPAASSTFNYYEMSGSTTVSKTMSLLANSTYEFKVVYISEHYGKSEAVVERTGSTTSNSISDLTVEEMGDNIEINTDIAGNYTFNFNTSTKTISVTYPTAYTVTFGMGTGGGTIGATVGGNAISSGDYVAAGSDVTFAQTASSTGYTFSGWYDASTGGSAVATMGVSDNVLNSIAANATVYSRYTPNEYLVTFDATTNGGTCDTENKTVTYAAAYGELPIATRASKAFKGWFTTSGGSTQVTAETIVSSTSNHTLFAQFEDVYSVTIDYKCGTVKLRNSSSITASATALAPEITAPEILGYEFSNWSGEDATFGNASSATTTVNATSATAITANYTAIPTVYFKNNLGWEHVYVTFDNDWTTGSNIVPKNNGKPYYEMEQLGTSDIFSCRIPSRYTDNDYANWAWNIAFDDHGFEASDNVGSHTGGFDAGEFLGRGDFDPSATMFIPYDGDSETRNGGTYYRTGCWMKYNSTDPGYKIYANTYVTGSGGEAVDEVLLTADIAGGFEFKAKVNFPNADWDYGFILHKEKIKNTNAEWYTNRGAYITSATTTLPWDFTSDENDATKRCGIHTAALGDYEFTVSFGTGKPMVNVTYPVSEGDWKLVYKDLAAWSGDAHDADWSIASRVIKAKANAEDIVSFFVNKATGANATIELQKCTAINASTGAETWTKQGSNLDLSGIEGTGIYNFKITQDENKVASAAYNGSYNGNFYIRTDASDGGWSNYKTSGTNTMTYSEYAEENSGFTHYFTRYIKEGANIKFCIANDYSPRLTEYCIDDDYTGEWIEANGNVRFMWDHRTNAVSRAYISGSSTPSDRFLVLEGDDKMFDEDGNDLTGTHQVSGLEEYEMKFIDDQNWIYEATVKAQPGARIKLTAKYNDEIQYFYGAEGDRSDETTDLLLGGSGTDKYKIRIVYDFKTNRLMKAFMPDDTINTNLAINADLMIIREAQEDAKQITFKGSGKLSEVLTVYGAMKFNKYTVNQKAKAYPHAATDASRYERDLFYISFPFDVKLSDAFGFGTYGKHWIIEYYDGKGRAANGYWADSESNWKFVMPSQRSSFTLKANEGYILALDLDEMTESSYIWNNGVVDVYLYFPSDGYVRDIQATSKLVTIDQTGYECKIGPRPGMSDDRRAKDSYWHCIGVPSFANYSRDLSETNGGKTIDWRNTSMPYLYEWVPSNNSLNITASATFAFKPMYSYLVQYAGESIYWSEINSTPSTVVARQKDVPTDVEFRLELQQGSEKADQAFVRLTDDEHVTTGYDFNYDLSKEFNKNKANVYTMITSVIDNEASLTEAAGNVLPMREQTTVVPVGVKIATNADYTFSIPDGTEGVGVTLIDKETGVRTVLSAVDYTVSLEAGTYNERFVIEIAPIQHIATELEQSAISDQQSDVRKVLIDGLLYIVRENKVYDARGARVE